MCARLLYEPSIISPAILTVSGLHPRPAGPLPNAPWFHDFCSWKRARAGRNLTLVLVFRGGEKAKKNRRNEPRTYTGPRTEPAPAVLGSENELLCGKLGKDMMLQECTTELERDHNGAADGDELPCAGGRSSTRWRMSPQRSR